MTLEEVWSNLTILSNNSVVNLAIINVCLSIILAVVFFVLAVKDYTAAPRPLCICCVVLLLLNCGIRLSFYLTRPKQIILQVEVETETVSAEQMSKYFELSDISIGDGKMICSIEPRFNYFDDKDNYYDEVAKLLEGKDEM